MFKVFDLTQKNEWNKIIKRNPNWDTYYLNEYVETMTINDKSKAFLFCYDNDEELIYEIFLKKDISDFKPYKNRLEGGKFFDLQTPYGYGGIFISKNTSAMTIKSYTSDFIRWCNDNLIVSIFVRYSPLLKNNEKIEDFYDNFLIKNTIYIDTSISDEEIFNNMDGKNRNLIRKAIKSGVTVVTDKGQNISDFINIYDETMDRKNAVDFYYFTDEYYRKTIDLMKNNFIVFYSMYQGQTIGASMFYYNNNYMHYHLSGVKSEFRGLCSNNLLLYEASKWAHSNGIKFLHLGGGVGNEDSLFHFKKQFNKTGEIPFYLGRKIMNMEKYNYLLNFRKSLDESFDINNMMLIQYRG